ncbi:hypothetical protein B0T17DRAFT_306815 [Bombardia bombarda]|uniref:Uncharacterized protein n=1 Tax=Bombardia bombarda TaxID=252184 RepID=A0AA39WUP2_9PEZI|nr:hypothetical protein B0T17DRAFT_306815 [Bombardia bombarda]
MPPLHIPPTLMRQIRMGKELPAQIRECSFDSTPKCDTKTPLRVSTTLNYPQKVAKPRHHHLPPQALEMWQPKFLTYPMRYRLANDPRVSKKKPKKQAAPLFQNIPKSTYLIRARRDSAGSDPASEGTQGRNKAEARRHKRDEQRKKKRAMLQGLERDLSRPCEDSEEIQKKRVSVLRSLR